MRFKNRNGTCRCDPASSSPERHSHAVARYLTHEGYDVNPCTP